MLDLSRLTAEQRSVVLAPEGPLVVVAGPGSGKTTVLAARVAYLVARGVPPASVLALTFTTAAARELRARLARILGEPGQRVDVRTFHGWGLRVVRHWSAEFGFPAGPVAVYDSSDALGILREAIATLGLDPGPRPLAELYRELERDRLAAEERRRPGGTADLVAAYEAALLRRGAVDFPGMLALPLRLLRRDARALRLYQDAYQYLLADEAQDVCVPQLELLAMLAARHRNLVVVGDPWQTLVRRVGAH